VRGIGGDLPVAQLEVNIDALMGKYANGLPNFLFSGFCYLYFEFIYAV
jgi:hypothetical protein